VEEDSVPEPIIAAESDSHSDNKEDDTEDLELKIEDAPKEEKVDKSKQKNITV